MKTTTIILQDLRITAGNALILVSSFPTAKEFHNGFTDFTTVGIVYQGLVRAYITLPNCGANESFVFASLYR